MSIKFLLRALIIIAFIFLVTAVIAYARGYRFDLRQKSLKSTGIISVSSNPKAAKIYVNNELRGVTDTNLTLSPGSYQIDIKKDGFTSWSKTISLKGELVMTVDALLFPSNPSLSPLTNLGITKAVPLDQTDRILLFVENSKTTDIVPKDGIYLFEANKKPLTILSPLKLLMPKKLLPANYKFIPDAISFSPDYKEAIMEFTDNITDTTDSFLVSLDEENKTLFDVTTSQQTLIDAWEKEIAISHEKILETYPKEIIKVASESFRIISFSPNETKVLYQALQSTPLPIGITPPVIATNQSKESRTLQKDHFYVYDKKEDKNYEINLEFIRQNLEPNKKKIPDSISILDSKFLILNSIQWYPDSRHLIVNETSRIIVMDYDGNNKQTVYSAAFQNTFITTTSDGNLVVLANLNPEGNKYPDLYAVGIK